MRALPSPEKLVTTFSEDFAPSWVPGGKGPWKSNYWFGDQTTATSRMIPGAGERQIYIEKGFKGLPNSPFWASDKADNPYLLFQGQPLNSGDADKLEDKFQQGYRPAYSSGLITTEKTFVQRYGLFELDMQHPRGDGVWPAFWLAPWDGLSTELDVCEGGRLANAIASTVHWTDAAGKKQAKSGWKRDIDATKWHRYALLWTADLLTWYFDGVPFFELPNPGVHAPHYMLINLAIGNVGWKNDDGSDFIGQPDGKTTYQMRVRRLRASRLVP